MNQPERYEVLVLGSGAGGKFLAWHLARSGRRTAVVERCWIGGSCPNINCLPSKNEIWSAKLPTCCTMLGISASCQAPSRSTWRKCGSGSATWLRAWSPCTCTITRRAALI